MPSVDTQSCRSANWNTHPPDGRTASLTSMMAASTKSATAAITAISRIARSSSTNMQRTAAAAGSPRMIVNRGMPIAFPVMGISAPQTREVVADKKNRAEKNGERIVPHVACLGDPHPTAGPGHRRGREVDSGVHKIQLKEAVERRGGYFDRSDDEQFIELIHVVSMGHEAIKAGRHRGDTLRAGGPSVVDLPRHKEAGKRYSECEDQRDRLERLRHEGRSAHRISVQGARQPGLHLVVDTRNRDPASHDREHGENRHGYPHRRLRIVRVRRQTRVP